MEDLLGTQFFLLRFRMYNPICFVDLFLGKHPMVVYFWEETIFCLDSQQHQKWFLQPEDKEKVGISMGLASAKDGRSKSLADISEIRESAPEWW